MRANAQSKNEEGIARSPGRWNIFSMLQTTWSKVRISKWFRGDGRCRVNALMHVLCRASGRASDHFQLPYYGFAILWMMPTWQWWDMLDGQNFGCKKTNLYYIFFHKFTRRSFYFFIACCVDWLCHFYRSYFIWQCVLFVQLWLHATVLLWKKRNWYRIGPMTSNTLHILYLLHTLMFLAWQIL